MWSILAPVDDTLRLDYLDFFSFVYRKCILNYVLLIHIKVNFNHYLFLTRRPFSRQRRPTGIGVTGSTPSALLSYLYEKVAFMGCCFQPLGVKRLLSHKWLIINHTERLLYPLLVFWPINLVGLGNCDSLSTNIENRTKPTNQPNQPWKNLEKVRFKETDLFSGTFS